MSTSKTTVVTTASIGLVAPSATPSTSSALVALLDSTPGVSAVANSNSAPTTTSVQSTAIAFSTQAAVIPSLSKSPTSSNLASIGGSITTSTGSVQSPVLATGALKLPSFAEASAKTTTPVSGSTAPAAQFSFKPVFAAEQPSSTATSAVSQAVALSTANNGSFTVTASSDAANKGGTTASSGIFSFGTTPAVSATVPKSSAASMFGQGGDAKASTGGFQFNVNSDKTTAASSGSFQFNATPSVNSSPSSALPGYSSAVSSSATSSSCVFAFGSTTTTTQNLLTSTSSTASFNFNPSGTGITFGSTGGTFTATSSAASVPSVGAFGQTAVSNVPKTTAAATGIFSFGATSSQTSPSGQPPTSTTITAASIFGEAAPATAASPVFGQTGSQPAPAFGQTAVSNTTGSVFGAPKKKQQSSTFQFGGSTQQGSTPFSFTANSGKQEATTSASSTFNFTGSKTNSSFGNTFGQPSTAAFGAPNPAPTQFGQQGAQSTFGQTPTQNAFGQTNSQGTFGQSTSGQGMFGQQSTSQSGFGPGKQTSFGSQNGFGKTSVSQNVFGAASTPVQSQLAKGFDFAAAVSGGNKNTGFNFSKFFSRTLFPHHLSCRFALCTIVICIFLCKVRSFIFVIWFW